LEKKPPAFGAKMYSPLKWISHVQPTIPPLLFLELVGRNKNSTSFILEFMLNDNTILIINNKAGERICQ
jgi:hypothetical protein